MHEYRELSSMENCILNFERFGMVGELSRSAPRSQSDAA